MNLYNWFPLPLVDESVNDSLRQVSDSLLILGERVVNILSDTGAPDNGTGENGQFYFRRDGGTPAIYKKVGGVWVSLV
jgi:hypothetical protein